MWSPLKFFCLCGLIALAIDSGDTARPRIINGDPIKIRSRPFMISLHDRNLGFMCGGSIIHRYWVLTAYHCIPEEKNARQFFVRAGSAAHSTGGTIHWVSEAVYFTNTEITEGGIPKNDIILVRVKPKFQFMKSIRPINLPGENVEAPGKLWVTGWGQMRKGNRSMYPNELQTVKVNAIDYETCWDSVSWYAEVLSKETHICYFRPAHDACDGDSGGPLADMKIIYGVVSFGEDCGKFPGVYAKVSYYVRWINQVIKPPRRM